MQDKPINVLVDDRTVVVDGVALKCTFHPRPGVHAIRWRPGAEAHLRGYVERTDGNSAHFAGFDEIAPYARAWADAKAVQDKAAAPAEAEAQAQAAAEQARLAKFDTDNAKRAEELRAWEDKVEAERKAKEEEAAKAAKTAREAFEAEVVMANKRAEDMRAYTEAISFLGATDHEALKAWEEGRPLDPDLAERRRAARAVAKAEKTRLGIKV